MESMLAVESGIVCLHRIFRGKEGDPPGLAVRYSLLKMGARREVNRFSSRLVDRVRSDLGDLVEKEPERWAVCHIGGFGVPNAAALLAWGVAEAFGLRSVGLETGISAHPDVAGRYASLARARRMELLLRGCAGTSGSPPPVKGRRVLLLEDAVVTGTVLRHALARLGAAGAERVLPYAVLRIESRGDSAYEDRLNRSALLQGKERVLAEVLNAPRGIPTTRLVFLALEPGKGGGTDLARALTPRAILKLYLCAVEYFGSRTPESIDTLADSLTKETGARFPGFRHLVGAGSESLFHAVLEILERHRFNPPVEQADAIAATLRDVLGAPRAGKPAARPAVKRQRLKRSVRLGPTGIAIREGGRSTIDISVDPPPTKLMAMRHFLLETGYPPEAGLYIGNQTSSRDERDGILTAIRGLKVLAVDEEQAAVIPEARPIGPGMAATQKKLEELCRLPDHRLPTFVGLDVDDTLLGRKIVVDKTGSVTMTKEGLLEDRAGIAAAIVALNRRGVHVLILSDNSADSSRKRVVDPLESLLADGKIKAAGPIDVYASGMATRFQMAGSPGRRRPVFDAAYGTGYRLPPQTARRVLERIGGVTETPDGQIAASGLLGSYYTDRLAETGPNGRWVLRRRIEIVYPEVQLGRTACGNLEYPAIQQRDRFEDGSVAQIAILPIVSSETVAEELDERAMLVTRLSAALTRPE